MRFPDRRAAILGLASLGLSACAREAGYPLGRRDASAEIARLHAAFIVAVEPVVTFAFDSAVLSPRARVQIARQATWILAHPRAAVLVTGHTDLVGPPGYNYDLGRRRAAAVVSALMAAGVPAKRVAGIVSEGETDPVVPVPGRSRVNRRAVVAVAWLDHVPHGIAFGMDGVRAQTVYDRYQDAPLGNSPGQRRTFR